MLPDSNTIGIYTHFFRGDREILMLRIHSILLVKKHLIEDGHNKKNCRPTPHEWMAEQYYMIKIEYFSEKNQIMSKHILPDSLSEIRKKMQNLSDPEFTPEQKVLLWAIRTDHIMDKDIAGILIAGIDWKYVRETAAQHGVIPLIYRRLKGEMTELVPPDELQTLKILFRENVIRNIRMTQRLFQILDHLGSSGIAAMPFKGPALAVQAYGDLSMRRFRDLDILIHAEDVEQAYRILSDHGYLLINPGQMNIERKFGFLNQKDLKFSYQGNILELHWDVIERFLAVPLDLKEFWARSVPVEINGRIFSTLSPEDMILLLCFHGHKHGWQDIGWLSDLISMISHHPDLKWQEIFSRAENLGLKRIVVTSLFLAQTYGGIGCTPELESVCISDSAIPSLARDLQKNIFRSRALAISPFFYLKSRERFKDKALFLLYYPTNRFLVFLRWMIRPFTLRKLQAIPKKSALNGEKK